ncbi:type II secretion system F family protein [Rubrivivax rivuli]|uniref:Type II secretion system F family protein n=1 Tax=Rubrivivax rivuli TaxID=1862385 RepID=A0A437REH4_9BURK|nr:type II secretion system F family protein [Rubrivivax rivuli]RVU45122.1 type II secretion system F family protein [Rubrivivax rivuli]
MPEYLVRVARMPPSGRPLRVQAASPAAVAQALGLPPAAVLSVEPAQGPGALRRPRRPRALNLRLFSQELALLLQSGIPVLEALETLSEREGPAAGRGALPRVCEALREGLPVSTALGRVPEAFDPLFVAVVAASERSGQLAPALEAHAAYLRWTEELRAKLVAACIYPLLLLGAGLGVIGFLLLYVLPRFAGVFDALGNDLPAASVQLIHFGVWAAAHPAASGALMAALPLLAFAAWRWPPLRQRAAGIAWRLPGIGARWRVVVLARFYRGLALLLRAGVPVPASLQLLQGALAGPLQPALAAAQATVAQGQRLSQALQAQGLATPVALRMLRVGEGSGELALMLERAARFHDDEIARLSELVVRAVNPALMLVMGVVIGGIVVLMYLPIFSLMERVQ